MKQYLRKNDNSSFLRKSLLRPGTLHAGIIQFTETQATQD